MANNLIPPPNANGTTQGQPTPPSAPPTIPATPTYFNPSPNSASFPGQWSQGLVQSTLPAVPTGYTGASNMAYSSNFTTAFWAAPGVTTPAVFNPFATLTLSHPQSTWTNPHNQTPGSAFGVQTVVAGHSQQPIHFGPTPATPTISPKVHPLVQTPSRRRNINAINNRKVRIGRINKIPQLTEAQKKRFRIDDLVIGQGTKTFSQSRASRLLNLPGELRNKIYHFCIQGEEQVLIRRNLRMATLRPGTRLDRSRPIKYGDNEAEEKKKALKRKSMRPAVGLTQVCRQIRSEFYPLYLELQEVAIDITAVIDYIDTFFHNSTLTSKQFSAREWPFRGNVTIALGDRITEVEKEGLDLWPLLEVWANSIKIEAGFGRYSNNNVSITRPEGEAKDLYRLFGRKVLRDRSCSAMNRLWRTTMRSRSLERVIIHRAPADIVIPAGYYMAGFGPSAPGQLPSYGSVWRPTHTRSVKPYIHIVYRHDCADSSMPIPERMYSPSSDWLQVRGFDNMEFFDIKVSHTSPFKDRIDYPNRAALELSYQTHKAPKEAGKLRSTSI